MCRMAAADGITHQVATPHANDRYHYDRAYLQGLVAHLQNRSAMRSSSAWAATSISPTTICRMCWPNPARYAIEGTHYMLVELSNYSVPQQTTDCFMQLGDRGITAIITHPERNPILRESLQRVVEWAEQGCVIQVTASALTGFWGERVRRAALWLLEHDAVHVLATDAHDTEKRDPSPLIRTRCRRGNLRRGSGGGAGREPTRVPLFNRSPCLTFPRPVLGSYRKHR